MELHFDYDYFRSGGYYFYCLSIRCPLLASFEVFSNPVDMLVSFYGIVKRLEKHTTNLILIEDNGYSHYELIEAFYSYLNPVGLFSNISDHRVFQR